MDPKKKKTAPDKRGLFQNTNRKKRNQLE
jgi:hypothetical protein